ALVTGPRVVFADEPTGALDSLAGEQLMDELTRTARADGITLVIVTHDNRVAAYADRELVLRDGELAAEVAA
ncbi:ABC transporter ATP-binding protein, partial [Nonomuraea sp. NPDC048901]